jgi:hypothetical protein
VLGIEKFDFTTGAGHVIKVERFTFLDGEFVKLLAEFDVSDDVV